MERSVATFCILSLILHVTLAGECESSLSPEKRFMKAKIAVKALVNEVYDDVIDLWILDVYKGEDKLASGLGLPGTGADAVFHLKDQ